jgi:MFS family permease
VSGSAYTFGPNERPLILGGTFNPAHPPSRMLSYFAIGILTAITAGLGNALISVNLPYIQGALGLYSDEGAWLSTAFVMTNVCANLLLVRIRIQFGVENFVKWMLAIYAVLILANLFVSGFWMAVLARAASGLAALR